MNQISYIDKKTHFELPHTIVRQLFIDCEEVGKVRTLCIKFALREQNQFIDDWILITDTNPLVAYTGAWMHKYIPMTLMDFEDNHDNYNHLVEYVSNLTLEDLIKIKNLATPA